MKELPIGNRLMDRAYLRTGKITHTDEALLLACLVASKGKTQRGNTEMTEVGKIMNDHNLPKTKRK